LSNTDASRFGTFTFFVVIADATGVGLLAFLAQLRSHFHFLQFVKILSKMRPSHLISQRQLFHTVFTKPREGILWLTGLKARLVSSDQPAH
jgi:hypothetical protein